MTASRGRADPLLGPADLLTMHTDTFTLERTGDSPLRVIGTLVARASSQQPATKRDLPLERRWHELALYRTQSGQHVGHISYHTTWPGELGDALARAGTLSDLADWFRDYDPAGPVVGFPAGRGFAERQRALLEAIELGYDSALSRLLSEAGSVDTVD